MLESGEHVVGVDNLNNYYDVNLKRSRLNLLSNKALDSTGVWNFYETDIQNYNSLYEIFNRYTPRVVFHLAAQAGVRYSLENPSAYINSNLVGFGNILELCRLINVENFIYASSSSVYGGNQNFPFKEKHSVDHPVSLYAATKKSNELMAHTYSHLYNLPATGLRFFTVYGPWGRPDMAPMIFTKSILNGDPISVFNYGQMERDFTYIDDIIEGVFRCGYKPATIDNNFNHSSPDPSTSFAPHRIFNIGNNKPVKLLEFIQLLENALDRKAQKEFKPMQPGDVVSTYAETAKLQSWIDFCPDTSIENGVNQFVEWYKKYYKR